jgi:hypothetical protein
MTIIVVAATETDIVILDATTQLVDGTVWIVNLLPKLMRSFLENSISS